jgi:hypothetical protein
MLTSIRARQAAIFVIAEVYGRRKELSEEVSRGCVEFDPIVARFFEILCYVSKAVDDIYDVFISRSARLFKGRSYNVASKLDITSRHRMLLHV